MSSRQHDVIVMTKVAERDILLHYCRMVTIGGLRLEYVYD